MLGQSSEPHLQRTQIKGRKNVVQECATKGKGRRISTVLESNGAHSSTRINLRLHDEIGRVYSKIHAANVESHIRRRGVARDFIDSLSTDIGSRRVE